MQLLKLSPAGASLFTLTGLNGPSGLLADPAGNFYVANWNGNSLQLAGPQLPVTVTIISSSNNPQWLWLGVTLTITITPVLASTGLISVYDNNLPLLNCSYLPIVSGVASCSLSPYSYMSTTIRSLVASYTTFPTSCYWQASNSSIYYQYMNSAIAPTSIVVTSYGTPSMLSSSVTYFATVNSTYAYGTVTFYDFPFSSPTMIANSLWANYNISQQCSNVTTIGGVATCVVPQGVYNQQVMHFIMAIYQAQSQFYMDSVTTSTWNQQVKQPAFATCGWSTAIPTAGFMTFDAVGNLWISTLSGNSIYVVNASTGLSHVVTSGNLLNNANGISFDPSYSNLYIANYGAGTIIKYNLFTHLQLPYVSGLSIPVGLLMVNNNATAGPILYVAEIGANYVTKIPLATGVPMRWVSIASVNSMIMDALNNLYVTSDSTNFVYKITPAGTVTTFATTSINHPNAVIIDFLGYFWVASQSSNTILQFSPTGTLMSTLAGYNNPIGLVTDGAGNIFAASAGGNVLQLIGPQLSNSLQITSNYGSNITYSQFASVLIYNISSTPMGIQGSITVFLDGSPLSSACTNVSVGLWSNNPNSNFSCVYSPIPTSFYLMSTHIITAVFTPFSCYWQSSTATFIQSVIRNATTISITSSKNPAAYNESISFTAMLMPAALWTSAEQPLISFYELNNQSLTPIAGCINLPIIANSNGTAICTVSAFTYSPNSIHSIISSYSGDIYYSSATSSVGLTSGSLQLIILQQLPMLNVITSSNNPTTLLAPVTYTATITPVQLVNLPPAVLTTGPGTNTLLQSSSPINVPGTYQFSLSMWFSTPPISSYNLQLMFEYTVNSAAYASFCVSYSDNTQTFSTTPGSILAAMSTTPGYTTIATNGRYDDRKWHHLVATFDRTATTTSNVIKLYMDGSLASVTIGRAVLYSTPVISSAPVFIGGRSGPIYVFNGEISNVQLWSRTILTPNVVQQIYNTGIGMSAMLVGLLFVPNSFSSAFTSNQQLLAGSWLLPQVQSQSLAAGGSTNSNSMLMMLSDVSSNQNNLLLQGSSSSVNNLFSLINWSNTTNTGLVGVGAGGYTNNAIASTTAIQTTATTTTATQAFINATSTVVTFFDGTSIIPSCMNVNANVSVLVQNNVNGSMPVAAVVATCIVNYQPGASGTHNITANAFTTISGSPLTGNSSSLPLTELVTLIPVTLSVFSSSNPCHINSAVTYSVLVSPSTWNSGVITLYDNGTIITGCMNLPVLTGTIMNCTISAYTYRYASIHAITAVHMADSTSTQSYSPAGLASGSLNQLVLEFTPTISISSSTNPSLLNQPITYTATITPPVNVISALAAAPPTSPFGSMPTSVFNPNGAGVVYTPYNVNLAVVTVTVCFWWYSPPVAAYGYAGLVELSTDMNSNNAFLISFNVRRGDKQKSHRNKQCNDTMKDRMEHR